MPQRPPCSYTHGLIASGPCPWCDEPVIDGQLRPDVPLREAPVLRWNIAAMLEALDASDERARTAVADALLTSCGDAVEALPVYRKALCCPGKWTRFLTLSAIYHSGRCLSREEVERLERECREHPGDAVPHLLLLGYYYLPATVSEEARTARLRHVLWVIENTPDFGALGASPLDLDPANEARAYEQAKRLWLRHVEASPHDPTLLDNAALFFFHSDAALCEDLLKRAQVLDPANPQWGERLGSLYAIGLHQRSGEALRDRAAKGFAELQRSYGLQQGDDLKRFRMLPELAKAAYEAGEFAGAKGYATEALSKVEQPGYFYHREGRAVHFGHLVLGRLALREGDVGRAKWHLLESGKTEGDPALCTGGPNMTLAKELLERGERDVVVEFLHLCTNFWKSHDHRPETWAYAIEHGEVPEFGANLDY